MSDDPPTAPAARLRHHWRSWLRPLLVMCLILFSFRSALADWNDVPTGSMIPTILKGERIFINKAAYDLRVPFTQIRLWTRAEPERGQIVILTSPVDGRRLVKRVVGVPGDHLEVRGKRLLLNGEVVPWEPLAPGLVSEVLGTVEHQIRVAPYRTGADDSSPCILGPVEFFVMGDNRDNSLDSRSFGPVQRAAIQGHVLGVVASVDPDRWYRPRWERFFQPLR